MVDCQMTTLYRVCVDGSAKITSTAGDLRRR